MKHSTDYLSLIQSIPPPQDSPGRKRPVLYIRHAYQEACRIRSLTPEPSVPSAAWIRAASVHGQLVQFLALSGTSHIPVIVPADMKYVPESLITEGIPAGACMGVLTSGSTGQPKLWFRTLDSWASFFPTQNAIFGMTAQTRLFCSWQPGIHRQSESVSVSSVTRGIHHHCFPCKSFCLVQGNRASPCGRPLSHPSKLRLLAKYIPSQP